MWDVSPGFPARFASRILAGRPRIFPSSFRGAVMSQRFPRGGSPPSGPARPGLPRPGSPRAVQERVVQGRPASPLGRGCNFWSCTLTVQGNRRFCHDHEMGRRRGIVDDCPDCGRGKDSRYPCCLECRRDRDAVDVGVPPSRSFPQAPAGGVSRRPAPPLERSAQPPPTSAAAAARAPGPSALPGSAMIVHPLRPLRGPHRHALIPCLLPLPPQTLTPVAAWMCPWRLLRAVFSRHGPLLGK